MEYLNLYLKDVLTERPHTRVPSADTVLRGIEELATDFYRYIVALPFMAVLFGIKATDRVKSFLFRFIAVPAKWIKTARQYKLNIYSEKPYDLIWEHG